MSSEESEESASSWTMSSLRTVCALKTLDDDGIDVSPLDVILATVRQRSDVIHRSWVCSCSQRFNIFGRYQTGKRLLSNKQI